MGTWVNAPNTPDGRALPAPIEPIGSDHGIDVLLVESRGPWWKWNFGNDEPQRVWMEYGRAPIKSGPSDGPIVVADASRVGDLVSQARPRTIPWNNAFPDLTDAASNSTLTTANEAENRTAIAKATCEWSEPQEGCGSVTSRDYAKLVGAAPQVTAESIEFGRALAESLAGDEAAYKLISEAQVAASYLANLHRRDTYLSYFAGGELQRFGLSADETETSLRARIVEAGDALGAHVPQELAEVATAKLLKNTLQYALHVIPDMDEKGVTDPALTPLIFQPVGRLPVPVAAKNVFEGFFGRELRAPSPMILFESVGNFDSHRGMYNPFEDRVWIRLDSLPNSFHELGHYFSLGLEPEKMVKQYSTAAGSAAEEFAAQTFDVIGDSEALSKALAGSHHYDWPHSAFKARALALFQARLSGEGADKVIAGRSEEGLFILTEEARKAITTQLVGEALQLAERRLSDQPGSWPLSYDPKSGEWTWGTEAESDARDGRVWSDTE